MPPMRIQGTKLYQKNKYNLNTSITLRMATYLYNNIYIYIYINIKYIVFISMQVIYTTTLVNKADGKERTTHKQECERES